MNRKLTKTETEPVGMNKDDNFVLPLDQVQV